MEINGSSNTQYKEIFHKFLKKAYGLYNKLYKFLCRLYEKCIDKKSKNEIKIDNLKLEHHKLKLERLERQKKHKKLEKEHFERKRLEEEQHRIKAEKHREEFKRLKINQEELIKDKKNIENIINQLVVEAEGLEIKLDNIELKIQNIKNERAFKKESIAELKKIEELKDQYERECLQHEYLRQEELEEEYLRQEHEILKNIKILNKKDNLKKNSVYDFSIRFF